MFLPHVPRAEQRQKPVLQICTLCPLSRTHGVRKLGAYAGPERDLQPAAVPSPTRKTPSFLLSLHDSAEVVAQIGERSSAVFVSSACHPADCLDTLPLQATARPLFNVGAVASHLVPVLG
jgi:hypothetical protein